MEGGIDILGHAGRVAADVEMSAGFEPRPELRGDCGHALLDVDFFGLVSGEGEVEAGEDAGGLECGEFVAVEEIGGRALVA